MPGLNPHLGATVAAGIEVMKDQWLRRMEECFWPHGFRRDIWMVVDAARDRSIFPMLQELHLEYYCLYSGPLAPALEAVAPFLVQLDYDDSETRRFLKHAWGNSWGIFLKCGMHANTVRRHLREFLVVRDPDGNRLVFRYYDPRVLRIFLPTCTGDELHALFGSIERFWMEDDQPGAALEFSLDLNRLVEIKISLEPGEGL